MSKKEIIDAMADAAEITKEKAGAALDALTSYIEGSLKKGDEVFYGKYAGTEIKIDGKEFVLLKESDVLAIIEK